MMICIGLPDSVISKWLSNGSYNRHWLLSHDEFVTLHGNAVIMAVCITGRTKTTVSQRTFVQLTCSSQRRRQVQSHHRQTLQHTSILCD